MAFCRLVFAFLILSVVSCYASKVPVYMWGALPKTSLKANPLMTISQHDFSVILKHELNEDQFTVVFIEETLSVEDFSSKNSDGETAFPYLYNSLGESIYLPSVQNALHALNKRAGESKTSITLDENGLSKDIAAENLDGKKYLFINLKDARGAESRVDFLRRHNNIMEEIMTNMQARYGKVVAVYTAHFPSWIIPKADVAHSRVRRATTRTNVYALDGLRMYAQAITLKSNSESTALTTLSEHTSEFNTTDGTMATKMVFENSTNIILNFYKKAGYWFFKSVTLNIDSLTEELMPAGEEVFAIDGFSYRCAQNVGFFSVNQTRDYSINFQDLKIQPFFDHTNNTQGFGESFNCVGFFTAPIWAGLFVVFILLLITFYGIMMMMDIRTMDRFDDPKGKTITINAE